MNLSKDVFERRTSTGSGLFSFLDSGFAHFLGQLVSIIVKTRRNTNLGASRCFKMKKTSLPVDVRRSKTPLLKLPMDVLQPRPQGLLVSGLVPRNRTWLLFIFPDIYTLQLERGFDAKARYRIQTCK